MEFATILLVERFSSGYYIFKKYFICITKLYCIVLVSIRNNYVKYSHCGLIHFKICMKVKNHKAWVIIYNWRIRRCLTIFLIRFNEYLSVAFTVLWQLESCENVFRNPFTYKGNSSIKYTPREIIRKYCDTTSE